MKIKEIIGLLLFVAGWITLDNSPLIIPMAVAGLGAWLMKDLMVRGDESECER